MPERKGLLAWARFNRGTLTMHELHATGTTGSLLQTELGLDVARFLSGIAKHRIDAVSFSWDPLEPHPHDVDVKALLRIAVVDNVPIACNRATADFMHSSPRLRTRLAAPFSGRRAETRMQPPSRRRSPNPHREVTSAQPMRTA